jgi:hypothetical protein
VLSPLDSTNDWEVLEENLRDIDESSFIPWSLLLSNTYKRCALATLSITRRYIYCYFGSSPKGATKVAPKPLAVSLQSLKCLFSTKAVCPPVGGLYKNGKSVSDNCFMGDL